MTVNELIVKLQNDVLDAVNTSKMPLMVKAIVLENVLLKVNASIRSENEKQQEAGSESEPFSCCFSFSLPIEALTLSNTFSRTIAFTISGIFDAFTASSTSF